MEIIMFWTKVMWIAVGLLFIVIILSSLIDPVASGIRAAERQMKRINNRKNRRQ